MRGPLDVLKEYWTGDDAVGKPVAAYVLEMRNRPEEMSSYSRREVVWKELDAMLEAGVIGPSSSPWASPIVLVEKKDGSIRFCVDFRKVSKFDAYPMPRTEEILESVGPAKVVLADPDGP